MFIFKTIIDLVMLMVKYSKKIIMYRNKLSLQVLDDCFICLKYNFYQYKNINEMYKEVKYLLQCVRVIYVVFEIKLMIVYM
jgi:hypothetical protein